MNTATWYPLARSRVFHEVHDQPRGCGFIVKDAAHALNHDGARYFGVLNITMPGRGIFEPKSSNEDEIRRIPKGMPARSRVSAPSVVRG
jgi:hypothetical protein